MLLIGIHHFGDERYQQPWDRRSCCLVVATVGAQTRPLLAGGGPKRLRKIAEDRTTKSFEIGRIASDGCCQKIIDLARSRPPGVNRRRYPTFRALPFSVLSPRPTSASVSHLYLVRRSDYIRLWRYAARDRAGNLAQARPSPSLCNCGATGADIPIGPREVGATVERPEDVDLELRSLRAALRGEG